MDPMDVVRALYGALNRGDVEDIRSLYHDTCIVERIIDGASGVFEGRDEVYALWAGERARVDVGRIAGIETGWGWVRAEWRTTLGGRPVRGYSHFWIEDGLIRRERDVEDTGSHFPKTAKKTPGIFSPVVGVGAVIFDTAGRVLLVKRRQEPLAGQWSLPGGKLELGETLEAGVAREIREETNLDVDVGHVVEVFDRILLDDEGAVRYHFVLVDYLCQHREGTARAGSDVEDVAWAGPADLAAYRVTDKVRDVVAKAVRLREEHSS
jgi:8-oxo-dGTP diphosphatase